MNLIILGPQGSGKGTQAELIVEKFGLFYMEMGDYLREVAKSNPEIDEIVNERGKLVPDNIVFNLMISYIDDKVPNRDNILFDGYPRSIKQYDLLKNWLNEKEKKIDRVIVLEISEDESIRRLSARRIDEETGEVYNLITKPPGTEVNTANLYQRDDDKPETVKQRLKVYHEITEPLIKTFEKEGILVTLNGERPIKEIFSDIVTELM